MESINSQLKLQGKDYSGVSTLHVSYRNELYLARCAQGNYFSHDEGTDQMQLAHFFAYKYLYNSLSVLFKPNPIVRGHTGLQQKRVYTSLGSSVLDLMDLIDPIGGPAFSSRTLIGGLWRRTTILPQ